MVPSSWYFCETQHNLFWKYPKLENKTEAGASGVEGSCGYLYIDSEGELRRKTSFLFLSPTDNFVLIFGKKYQEAPCCNVT